MFPSLIPLLSKYIPAHIPLERGGAGATAVHSVHPQLLVIEPTSLMRGEGVIAVPHWEGVELSRVKVVVEE